MNCVVVFSFGKHIETIRKMSYLASAMTADLVTFIEEILNGKLHFLCGDKTSSRRKTSKSFDRQNN